ncbi:hypothetical protein PR003_g6153 [Phytophthora rubi]|uniref:Uncharacterized protein n=1 Tax=Phytophthora rubi TaxID=129364 RepID=A0A6A3NAE2_9STRA|nr:hypothetical protein PR002_g6143 [Phytophthora rubi]KAE9043380.1 hypothetical protein PR001_g5820 [Phytophthora rubi]KAE9348942.1 hypothetical protein PR003_g6153 [Phytophthora rubi]
MVSKRKTFSSATALTVNSVFGACSAYATMPPSRCLRASAATTVRTRAMKLCLATEYYQIWYY